MAQNWNFLPVVMNFIIGFTIKIIILLSGIPKPDICVMQNKTERALKPET